VSFAPQYGEFADNLASLEFTPRDAEMEKIGSQAG